MKKYFVFRVGNVRNLKLHLGITPHSTFHVDLPEHVSNLVSVVFVLVSGALTDDFFVFSDGYLDTFSYRLEHLRFLMGCENSGLLSIPNNYYFFDCTQLDVFKGQRNFQIKSEKDGAVLDMYLRYDGCF